MSDLEYLDGDESVDLHYIEDEDDELIDESKWNELVEY
jgi:hypothetical protein